MPNNTARSNDEIENQAVHHIPWCWLFYFHHTHTSQFGARYILTFYRRSFTHHRTKQNIPLTGAHTQTTLPPPHIIIIVNHQLNCYRPHTQPIAPNTPKYTITPTQPYYYLSSYPTWVLGRFFLPIYHTSWHYTIYRTSSSIYIHIHTI